MRINPDNRFIHVMNTVFDVAVTYIIYLLCCLPVVTIGAATTALHATLLSVLEDSCSGILQKFFGRFKADFKISSWLWLLFVLTGAVVVADVVICFGYVMEQVNSILYIMRGVTIFCVVLYTSMFQYTFAGLAKFEVTWKQALRNALWFMTKAPLYSMGIFVLTVAAAFCLYIGLIWALPVVMVLVYLQELMILHVFDKILGTKRSKSTVCDETIYYE